MKFINFGSLNIDYVYRVPRFVQPGETLSSLDLSVGCGGKGLNQSVALAQAGAETYHAGLLGDGAEFLREKLLEKGVRCEYLRRYPGANGHAIIQVNEQGQNCILLYPGTNHALTRALIDEVLDRFAAGDVLLLQNETNELSYLMEAASARALRVALNAAPMTKAVPQYPLHLLKWLLVNETEGAALTGQTDTACIADALADRLPQTEIVLTLGTEGAIYRCGAERVFVPARRVAAVDTTAAGDTFTGYFLAARAEGKDAEYAMRLATAASAIAVTRHGAADSVPTLAEVRATL